MRKTVLLAIPVVLATLAGVASSATIVQTQAFSGIPDLTRTLAFNQFDNQGGTRTLLSIRVVLSLTVSGGQLILDNDGEGPASGAFEFGGKAKLSSTDVALLDNSFQPVPGEVKAVHSGLFSLAGNVGDVPFDYDPNAPDGMAYFGATESDTRSGFVNSAFWAAGAKGFLGTGTYDITADALQRATYGSFSGVEHAESPVSTDGEVMVIYDYVPEPASAMLLAVGMAAGIVRRRMKG